MLKIHERIGLCYLMKTFFFHQETGYCSNKIYNNWSLCSQDKVIGEARAAGAIITDESSSYDDNKNGYFFFNFHYSV